MLNTTPKEITAKEARDNFSDLLGSVYYSKDTVIVKKQGRSFAVVVNPEEFKRYRVFKQAAGKRLLEIIAEIQTANKDRSFKRVYEEVTDEIEVVRKKNKGNN